MPVQRQAFFWFQRFRSHALSRHPSEVVTVDHTRQLAHRASKASMNERSHRPSRMLCIVASSLAR